MNYNLKDLLFESDNNTVHNLFEEQDKEKKSADDKEINITEESIDFRLNAQTEMFSKALANIIDQKFMSLKKTSHRKSTDGCM